MGLDSEWHRGAVCGYESDVVDRLPVLTYGGTPAMDSCGNPIYKGAIVNPATSDGGAFGCVFVNNQIPTSLISKTTAEILQLYHEYYSRFRRTLPTKRRMPTRPIPGSTTRRAA